MRVTLAVMASTSPMGQQIYEQQVTESIRQQAAPDDVVRTLELAGLRSAAVGVRRYPVGQLDRTSYRSARVMGALAYRTSGMGHRFDLRLPPFPGAEIVTIHDLPPMRFDDEGSMPRSAAEGARRAAAVIAPSRFAAREIVDLLGVGETRITVIPNGVSDVFNTANPPDAELRAALGLPPGRYVLHAGGASERKNLTALADAWRLLADDEADLGLCLVGPADPRRDLLFRWLPRVTILDRQPPPTIARLMKGAAAVVVPSRYEGFGLPALEAMATGVPVVASNCAALPEVCGGGALVVDPGPRDLCEGLRAVLSDNSGVASLLRAAGPARAAEFTWAASAAAHLAVYRAVTATSRRTARSSR